MNEKNFRIGNVEFVGNKKVRTEFIMLQHHFDIFENALIFNHKKYYAKPC